MAPHCSGKPHAGGNRCRGNGMVCFDLFGLRLALDFTAPALLALLSMYLSPAALCRTLAACLLHEAAHLLAIALTGQKPALLRISAAGLRLETCGTAVIPLHLFAGILLSGPLANLIAAAGAALLGMPETAAANLSLCGFNLLPFRSTDGGTLLHALLEQRYLTHAPELPRRIGLCLGTAAAAACFIGMYRSGRFQISLCAMLVFMAASEFADLL